MDELYDVIENEILESSEKVERVTGFGLEAIKSPTRKAYVCMARMLLVHDLRSKGLNLQEIGKAINRHYSSITHLLKTYRNEYETNPIFGKMAKMMK